jgi:hypothetical protein
MQNQAADGEVKMPVMETAEVADILRFYGLAEEIVAPGRELHPCRREAVGGLHDALRAGA